jgi:prolyl oligopeptidase
MRSILAVTVLVSLAAYSLGVVAADGPPATRVETVVDTYHGVPVADPYRWLERAEDPAVHAWTTAQTSYARAYLDALPFRAALERHLMHLISQSSTSYADLQAAGTRVFARASDPAKQQPLLVALDRNLDPAHARVVLDPNAIDATGAVAIDWYVPSPDGSKVAVSLSRGGSEDGDLHVFDVATGHEVGAAIPHVQYPTAGGDATWSADGRTIWYTHFPGPDQPAAERHFNQTVWVHRVGADPARDREVALPGLPRVAEITLDHNAAAGALLVTVANGDGGEYAHYLVTDAGVVHQITHFADEATFAALGPDGALYLESQRGAPRRQVLKLARGDYDLADARVIIPPLDDAAIFNAFQGGDAPISFYGGDKIVVRYLAGGPSRLRVFHLDGRHGADVPIPAIARVSEVEGVGNDLVYRVETYLTPPAFRRFGGGRDTATPLGAVSPIAFGDMAVVREMATSKDGTRVPVNVIRKKGTALDGRNPTLLYGYGGYGISQEPRFLGATFRAWFDAGGVFAIANIRGGGEFGETWHAEGALTHKQNVFDDFAAAAEWLIDAHYTSSDELAMLGGSNGGLLMGAMITQHPGLARAVVSEVGIYDMLRVELDPNGAFNTTEFGTVQHADEFRALYAYSPYHHVVDRTAYPAVLMQTGENDGRVNPMQSRKMTARLQAATSSNRPVLLVTTSAAGHGIGSPLAVRVGQVTDYTAFLFDQLGMHWTPPAQGQ